MFTLTVARTSTYSHSHPPDWTRVKRPTQLEDPHVIDLVGKLAQENRSL